MSLKFNMDLSKAVHLRECLLLTKDGGMVSGWYDSWIVSEGTGGFQTDCLTGKSSVNVYNVVGFCDFPVIEKFFNGVDITEAYDRLPSL